MDPALIANFPAATPPAGERSDFDKPAPDAVTLWVLSVLSLAIAFFALVIRLYVKRFITNQRLTWDDGTCILVLSVAIAHTGIILKELDHGLGKHMWNVRAISFTHQGLLTMTSANMVVALNMLLVRISILGLYHRLFAVYEPTKRLIKGGYVASVFVALPETGVVIGRMVLCTDVTMGLPGEMNNYCTVRTIGIAVITFAVSGLILDSYIYSIAFERLRKLQVTRGKKSQLTAIFAMGFLALSFSIANLIFVGKYFSTTDTLWFALWVAVFKFLEANIALACICTTFLPAFWKAKVAPLSSSVFRQHSLNIPAFDSYKESWSNKSKIPSGRGSDDNLFTADSFEMTHGPARSQKHAVHVGV